MSPEAIQILTGIGLIVAIVIILSIVLNYREKYRKSKKFEEEESQE